MATTYHATGPERSGLSTGPPRSAFSVSTLDRQLLLQQQHQQQLQAGAAIGAAQGAGASATSRRLDPQRSVRFVEHPQLLPPQQQQHNQQQHNQQQGQGRGPVRMQVSDGGIEEGEEEEEHQHEQPQHEGAGRGGGAARGPPSEEGAEGGKRAKLMVELEVRARGGEAGEEARAEQAATRTYVPLLASLRVRVCRRASV